ncbi:MAG TPA: hypothetical protein VFO01_03925 [Trebonia sp.]|nr:hypothetical protein [Trebonia sp.]
MLTSAHFNSIQASAALEHGCPDHHRPAKKNSEFWDAKIKGNIARDADTDARLRDAGWRVIRVWEHEDPSAAAARIKSIVSGV